VSLKRKDREPKIKSTYIFCPIWKSCSSTETLFTSKIYSNKLGVELSRLPWARPEKMNLDLLESFKSLRGSEWTVGQVKDTLHKFLLILWKNLRLYIPLSSSTVVRTTKRTV